VHRGTVVVYTVTGMTMTYLLCRTHQPQWGSPEPRHVLQPLYWEQLSTGRRLTCNTPETLHSHYRNTKLTDVEIFGNA